MLTEPVCITAWKTPMWRRRMGLSLADPAPKAQRAATSSHASLPRRGQESVVDRDRRPLREHREGEALARGQLDVGHLVAPIARERIAGAQRPAPLRPKLRVTRKAAA